ncbi:pre-mRNA-splicing factor cwc22 [Homalodisca vitripennis]|nr:pre-mRNA-splicing factor cwc22 [Homalodisca vitripennis]
MNKIEGWTEKLEQIGSVSDGIEAIKSDLGKIRDQLSQLEPRVLANESMISSLAADIKLLKNNKPLDSETVIAEVNDRNERSKKATLYGIPESSDIDIKSKIQHDKGIMDDVLQVLQLSDLHISKIVRIGKGNPGKPRPMKDFFRDPSEAISFFKNFNSPKLSNAFPDSTFEVYRDRTLKETYHLQELCNPIADRERNGEKGLTIKY